MAFPPSKLSEGTKGKGVYGVAAVVEGLGKVWQFAKEDTDRVKFAVKVGIALVITSIFILCGPTYRVFGDSIIWSIITVAIMFEYTVGATFHKGFNRALGSLFAGILAIVVIEVAISAGRDAEPYIIGLSIFLFGAVNSFVKLWPSMVPYEYGFRVALFTYCMIIVSGYRMGSPIRTAMDRLYSIAIGGMVAILVNVIIWPIWAGEKLHQELVKHLSLVADALEECVNKYLKGDGFELLELERSVVDDFPNEPAFKKCRGILNSSSKFESLAQSAKWEPPHGRFRQIFYPWAEYVKVGSVLRHCAYEVMALHGCLHSEIQAPYKLRIAFQSEIHEASKQAAELLCSLAEEIGAMSRQALHGTILKRVHSATDRLQRSVELHSYLLTPASHHATTNDYPSPTGKPPETNGDGAMAAILSSNYGREIVGQHRRLYSWPSREAGEAEAADMAAPVRMMVSESTFALSLVTFTSLLVEFMARLDNLVDAADELARLAKFNDEAVV